MKCAYQETVTMKIVLTSIELNEILNGKELYLQIADTTSSDDKDMYVQIVMEKGNE